MIGALIDSPYGARDLVRCDCRGPNSNENQVVIGQKVCHCYYLDGKGHILDNCYLNNISNSPSSGDGGW